MNQLPASDPRAPIKPGLTPVFAAHAQSRENSLGQIQNDYADPAGNDLPSGGLLEYWRILQRRKGTVILTAFLGLLGGFLYTVPQTPIYQARTLIEIQGLNEDFLKMRDVNPNASSGWDPTIDLQTQVRVLQSRALVSRVRKKLNTDTRPFAAVPTRFEAWRTILHLPEPKRVPARQSAVDGAAGGRGRRRRPSLRP